MDNSIIDEKETLEQKTKQDANKFNIDSSILENDAELEKVMESIIYVEGNIPISRLKSIFQCENEDLSRHIKNINEKYKNANSALEVLEMGNSVLMTVTPSVFGVLSSIYDKKRKKKISKAMLQTLSVIAYKQPITKAEIDDVRQSDSAYHLRTLMEDDFIEWKGRKNFLDKRQTYGTTDKFLIHFGISNVDELPKLRRSEERRVGKEC